MDATANKQEESTRQSGYARPDVLVTTQWVQEHFDDPNLRIVESDEDVLLYEQGHIPGAVKLDWHTDLQDSVVRDYVNRERFEELLSERGIGNDTTVVFYGDKNNWWATYAFWVFQLFGHTNAKVMDGGRQKWIAEDRPLTKDAPNYPRSSYRAPERSDEQIRAFRDQVLGLLNQDRKTLREGVALVDVRSNPEYTGELVHMVNYPQEGAQRGGHIPGAKNPLGHSGAGRWHVQAEGGAGGYLRRQGCNAREGRGGLLPHRRALLPYVVRAQVSAGVPTGA